MNSTVAMSAAPIGKPGMAGFRLLDGIHGEATDRIGHTGMIDLRHDENPPEMRSLLVGARTGRRAAIRAWSKGKSGLDSTSIPVSPRRGNAVPVRKVALVARPGPEGWRWRSGYRLSPDRAADREEYGPPNLAVHSFAAALRSARLPRKFRRSNRLPNREFCCCAAGHPRCALSLMSDRPANGSGNPSRSLPTSTPQRGG